MEIPKLMRTSLGTAELPRSTVGLRSQLLFVLSTLFALTLLLTCLRVALLAFNWVLVADASWRDLAEGLYNGLRFDMRVVMIAGAPLILTFLSSFNSTLGKDGFSRKNYKP